MPSEGETPFQRLARQVKARMQTQRIDGDNALADASGIKWDTIVQITRGTRTRITAPTVTRLETALGWSPGTIRGILNGEDPPEDRISVPVPNAADYTPEDFKRLTLWIEEMVIAYDKNLRGVTDGVHREEGER